MATADSPSDSPNAKRTDALSREKWQKLLDSDGRLVDEIAMRKTIFEGY